MFAEFVANDDELQISVLVVLRELALEDRKGLDQSVQVLVRTDLPRIENERVFQLVPLQNVFSLFGGVREREPFVERIMNNGYLRFGQVVNVQKILLRRSRHRENMPGGLHDFLRPQVTSVCLQFGRVFLRKQQVNAVVNGYHKLRRAEEWRFVVRDVDEVDTLTAQGKRDRHVIPPDPGVFRLIELAEVCRQRSKFVEIPV